ncbi:MAG: UDP-N-acetylmuramate--L-alanine ligase [Algoriphagus sp.]|uniref:UDP-N-acetylmuramate--L-alanine ligase n=1 Tax=Algoriphagus sp. TaxID=1872435 RepID=UPI0017C228AB|nr:UDP-N-acetylmuramate--L-alanine ligase [Algoriphagus sp.]NVJ86865.1 UDP-N-acetylmuramate--L-alanine ligase [Algoriphagus sp.]
MKLEGIHSVYFLGIGGIGMSALARWFHQAGYAVAGYDRTPSPLTDQLFDEGIAISFEDQVSTIPENFLRDKNGLLVIWTPAIPKESALYQFFSSGSFTMKKRSEVLGMLTAEHYTIAVAGTHGKTTTSSLIAHLLKSAGKPVTAFLGGITQNYQSNLILNSSKEATIMVVEADEFDRSFLRLHPDVEVVTSADPDHLDIYGDESTILDGFREFIQLLKKKGKLLIQDKAASKIGQDNLPQKGTKIYGLRATSGIYAENVQARPGSFAFEYEDGKVQIKNLELFIPGFHNVENALSAIAISLDHGLSPQEIKTGLATFRGVKRRFEILVQEGSRVYIDDYAHHPEEIRACLSSVRAMYPGKKLTVVFQPHLFSRTRDFAEGFSESLSLADQVLLLDIYPARELPIPGVSSEMLFDDIQASNKKMVTKEQLFDVLEDWDPEILVTMGAGDIDRLVPRVQDWMRSRLKPQVL